MVSLSSSSLVYFSTDSRLGLFVLSLFDLLLNTFLSKVLSHSNTLNFRALCQLEEENAQEEKRKQHGHRRDCRDYNNRNHSGLGEVASQ